MTEKKPERQGRGRPRLHKGEMATISIKVPEDLADTIRSAMGYIKLTGQFPHAPDAVLMLDALKVRMKTFHNKDPEGVKRRVEAIEKAIDKHYAHLPKTGRPA